jgi:hypothetical protein
MRALVFNAAYVEDIYYIAAYTLYRLKILISNKRIDQRYYKLRWHIIMAIKYYVCGEKIPQLSSPKIKKLCEDLEEFMSAGDDVTVQKIKGLCGEIVDMDDITRDKLKGSSLVPDVAAKALLYRQATPPK